MARNYKALLPPVIARDQTALKHYIAALEVLGDEEISLKITGMSRDDLKIASGRFPDIAEKIPGAKLKGIEHRLQEGIELMKKAKSVAMITENVGQMIEIAKIISPEVTVYPREREVARAKAEQLQSNNALQVNVALADLAGKLQKTLKDDAASRETTSEGVESP